MWMISRLGFFAFSLLTLCSLAGCPPEFPGCPEPPALEYSIPDLEIVGVWNGDDASITPPSVYHSYYDIGLVLNVDRSFSMNIHDNSGRYTVEGVWGVDASAKPYPRIQFGVACSDSDLFPESSWLRGSYLFQRDDVLGEDSLLIAVSKHPNDALDYPDWGNRTWRLQIQEN